MKHNPVTGIERKLALATFESAARLLGVRIVNDAITNGGEGLPFFSHMQTLRIPELNFIEIRHLSPTGRSSVGQKPHPEVTPHLGVRYCDGYNVWRFEIHPADQFTAQAMLQPIHELLPRLRWDYLVQRWGEDALAKPPAVAKSPDPV